jgi:hypothetical protein
LEEFGLKNALSEDEGDCILKIMHDFRSATWPNKTKVAIRWKSIKKSILKHTKNDVPLKLAEGTIQWPKC